MTRKEAVAYAAHRGWSPNHDPATGTWDWWSDLGERSSAPQRYLPAAVFALLPPDRLQRDCGSYREYGDLAHARAALYAALEMFDPALLALAGV